ncbi:caspase domain-containing protein [Cyathus striatus]|nr:caspase domain-containing protein [Cyathus striatus]
MFRPRVQDPQQPAPQFYPPPQQFVAQPMYNGEAPIQTGYPTTQQTQQPHQKTSRFRNLLRKRSTSRTRVTSNNLHPSSALHPSQHPLQHPISPGHHRSSSFPENTSTPPTKLRRHSHSTAAFIPPPQHNQQGTYAAPIQIAHSSPHAPVAHDYAYAYPQSQPNASAHGLRQRTRSFNGYTTQMPPGTYTPVQVPNGLLAPYMPTGMAHSSPGLGMVPPGISPSGGGHHRSRTSSNPYNPHSSPGPGMPLPSISPSGGGHHRSRTSSNPHNPYPSQGVAGSTKTVRYSPNIVESTMSQLNSHPSHRYPSTSGTNAAFIPPRAPTGGAPQGDPRGFQTGFSDIDKYLKLLPPSRNFSWSRCTGRKKAVCVGINYAGQHDELKGCANDARHMRDFLIKYYGFRKSDIMLLTDEQGGIDPTRKNIFDALHWLVRSARKDDSLFFHYSGHGGQVPDKTGQEKDGMNEGSIQISRAATTARLSINGKRVHSQKGITLLSMLTPASLFQSCHSGTVLDLPYLHSAHGRLRGLDHISHRARSRGAPAADVICFASCKDDETSADTFHGGIAVGAMSYAFIKVLKEHPKTTYGELLSYLRKTLIPKYHQKAQLSTTHPIDQSKDFVL